MPNKNIYVPDNEIETWNVVVAIASRRRSSISKMVVDQLKLIAREDNRNTGVPVGFKTTAALMDPKELERQRIADDFRAVVLEHLVRADEGS